MAKSKMYVVMDTKEKSYGIVTSKKALEKIGLEEGKVGKYIIHEMVDGKLDIDMDIYTKRFNPEGRWMKYYNQFIGKEDGLSFQDNQ